MAVCLQLCNVASLQYSTVHICTVQANTVYTYGHIHICVSVLYVTALYGRVQGDVLMEEKMSKKLKLRLKNTTVDKTLPCASVTCTLTKRERKQLNIFERKVYRRILGPVYDNDKENWRILANKEIYASVKNLL